MRSPSTSMWRGSAAVLVGNLSITATQLAVFVFLGQFTGTDALGAYSLCLAVAVPVFTALGLSLRTLTVASPEAWTARSVTGWALSAGVVAAALSIGVAFLVNAPVALMAGVAAVKVLDNAVLAGVGTLQRRDRLAAGSACLVANGAVTVAAASVAVLLPGRTDVGAIVAASVAGSAAALLLVATLTRRESTSEVERPAPPRDLVARGLPMSIGSAVTALATAAPIYVVGRSSQLYEAAALGVLTNVRSGLSIVFVAIAQVGLGRLASGYRAQDAGQLTAAYRRTLGATAAAAVAAATATLLLGVAAVDLVFDVELRRGGAVMAALCLNLLLAAWLCAVDARMQAVQAYAAQLPGAGVNLAVTVAALALLPGPVSVVAALHCVSAGLAGALAVKIVWTRRRIRRWEERLATGPA